MQMLAVTPTANALLLMLFGEIDLMNCFEMQLWVESHRAERVVLDLSFVEFMAACGARRLVEVQDTFRRRGSELRVVVANNPTPDRMLRLAGRFELFDSVVEAFR